MDIGWKGTRKEFEHDERWRATIQRGKRGVRFILSGNGDYGTFYEYAEGDTPYAALDRQPLILEELEREEELGELEVLKGNLPKKE